MAKHQELTGATLHVPGYVQTDDPGAVGAGKLWLDTTGGTGAYALKIRNATDDGWETVATAGSVPDAGDVTYTPNTLTDWDSSADPGDTNDALDQLAARTKTLEGAGYITGIDAADVTYTPAVAADWDGSADPGDTDQALDQLAERVTDVEAAALGDHAHAGVAGDGGTFDAANLTSGAAGDGTVLTADGSGGAAWEAVPAMADHDHSGDAGDGGTFDAANLTSSTATDGFVLTADGSGGAAWEAPGGGAAAFTDLTDAPAAYTDQGGKVVAVKATEDGLEFIAAAAGAATGEINLTAAGGWPSTTNGCAANAKNETTTNKVNYYSLDFDAAAIEYAEFAIPAMPSDWDGGTITAVFKWTAASGSGDVIWGIAGISYGNDDALDTAYGTAQTATDTLITAGDVHVTAATSAVTLAGTPAAGELVQLRVYRNATDGGDTLAVDAKLIGILVTYSKA